MIEGVYVPLLTAFGRDGAVDEVACVGHARWLVERGVQGVMPFGSTGEGPSLSVREKRSTLDALFAGLPGTPILPAITDSSLAGALELAVAVNDLPAVGILVVPPFYFRPLSDDDLLRFLEAVLTASRHPVLAYHIPGFAPPVPVPVVADLPLWGVKDSGGDLGYTRAVLGIGKQVMVGAEETIPAAIRAGARGTIAGMANVLPEHLVAAVAAARTGDDARAEELIADVLALRSAIIDPARPLGWLPALKMLAEHRHGIQFGDSRPPAPIASRQLCANLGPPLRQILERLPGAAGHPPAPGTNRAR